MKIVFERYLEKHLKKGNDEDSFRKVFGKESENKERWRLTLFFTMCMSVKKNNLKIEVYRKNSYIQC